jgi:type II secretory pathway pseudopilin PulG
VLVGAQKFQVEPARGGGYRCRARGFTLIDVLVSIFVIAVLISILLPSLGPVQETARRVACQSNVRQIGLGVVMYADDWNGQLPPSVFLPVLNGHATIDPPTPQNMLTLRLDRLDHGGGWDGIGWLYGKEYLTAPKVFFCPSHRGDNPYSRFAPSWNDAETEIVCNYHYRGQGPLGPMRPDGTVPTTRNLYQIDPAQSSLIADGMRVSSDCNHRVGVNFFRADLTVHWYSDPTRRLAGSLPDDKDDATAAPVDQAWGDLDHAANGGAGGG